MYDSQHTWPVQDAKARFSELLDACVAHGPQMLTRRGAQTAVLVPLAQWQALQRLQQNAPRSLKTLLLSSDAPHEIPIPARGSAKRRAPASIDQLSTASTVGAD